MKKKILIIISITIVAFTLVACGGKKEEDKNNNSNNSSQKEESNQENLETSQEEGKNEHNKDTLDNDNTSKDSSSIDKPINENTDNSNSEKETTEKDCRIFYYDFPNEKMIYVNKKVEVIDGALATALTKQLQDATINSGFLTLDSDAGVTSAKLDKATDTLHVYFNNKFNEITNLGTIAQCELIDSIVYTFGYNFDVKNVKIYVGGKPFSDSRGEKPEGYTVDTSRATEFK